MPATNNSFSELFSDYFLAISKYMADFSTFREERNSNGATTYFPEIMRVLYGTPSSAYRRIFNIPTQSSGTPDRPANSPTVNSRVNMPMFNFFATNFRREFARENPFVRLTGTKDNVFRDDVNKENIAFNAPQIYNISLQCTLWTSTYKMRDDLMSKILRSFRSRELYLITQGDSNRFPNEGHWIEIQMDENIQDDTEIEQLTEKETRDIIRTSMLWTITNAILPYEAEITKYVEKIQFNTYTKGREFSTGVLTTDGYQLNVINDNPLEFVVVKPQTLLSPVPPETPT